MRIERNVTRLLHPRPVVLITSRFEDKVNVMAAAWITPVSARPPIVAVSISPKRMTYEMILRSGEFAVNVLEMSYLRQVHLSGQISGRDAENKLEKVGLAYKSGAKIEVPVIDGASAVLECVVWRTVEAGDHVLFLGKVIAAYASEKFKEAWDMKSFRPILHVGGNRYVTAEEKEVII